MCLDRELGHQLFRHPLPPVTFVTSVGAKGSNLSRDDISGLVSMIRYDLTCPLNFHSNVFHPRIVTVVNGVGYKTEFVGYPSDVYRFSSA